MTTKIFGKGFFGRNPFDQENIKYFKEKWHKMTDNEKLEFMNHRMESFDNQEDIFSIEAMDAHCEEWLKMTTEEKKTKINQKKQLFKEKWSKMRDNEKLEFINKRMELFDNEENPFSVESMNARCEKWLKMTLEEKQVSINSKKQIFKERWSKLEDNEKLDFMNKKMGSWNKQGSFTIESMDARCEEWLKMTVEEKEKFMDRKGSFFQNDISRMRGFFR